MNNWLTGKDSDAGKDWMQEEKGTTEDEMFGWNHWLDGHEFEQSLGVGDGQRSLACYSSWGHKELYATATAKSLQSCPTLCDPIDSSPPGSPVPGILQARILEWVAISLSNAWKWKVKVKSLSRFRLFATHGLQPTRLFHPWDFPGKSTGVGCHYLLRNCCC